MTAIKKINTQQHYDLLHQQPTATSIVWTQNDKIFESNWHKFRHTNTADLSAFSNLNDVFLTPNEFYGWRRFDLLESLRACYIDIDNRDLTRNCINYLISDSLLPPPSIVVNSGRGWHLYWLIEPTPKSELGRWQHIQDTLIRAYNADPAARDCARVLRLVGSINSKNNKVVTGEVLDPVPWEFQHLCNEVLGYSDKKSKVLDIRVAKAERKHTPKTGSQSSIYSWWYLVYQDLHTIALSYPNGIPFGYRNTFLFIVSVAMSWFANSKSIREALIDRANKWCVGMSENEVEKAIKSSLERLEKQEAGETITYQNREVDPRYHYRRTTLYNLLHPIIQPEIAGELRAIISEEQRTQRRAERERARDRVAEGRHKRHYEGLNSSKPWEAEGISRATWYRRRKARKE